MAANMWFGTTDKMQWVPAPASGMRKSRNRWSQSVTLVNGGASVWNSLGASVSYEMDFPVGQVSTLDVFADYADGLYGTGLLYFNDPMIADLNLLPPAWAAPMLSLPADSYPAIGDVISSAATAANSYSLPSTTVTFGANTPTALTAPDRPKSVVIPIPPDSRLWWGWSGARTGSGVVAAIAHRSNGTGFDTFSQTPLSSTGAARLTNAPITGATYDYVTFCITRSALTDSTVSISGMMAQTHPIAVTPNLNGSHIPGKGNTGCRFSDEVIPETYVLRDPSSPNGVRRLVGLSASLLETGAWEIG